jgi:hypothetical protein
VLLASAAVVNAHAHRAARQKLLLDVEWRKFRLSAIFKGFVPPRVRLALDVAVAGCAVVSLAPTEAPSQPPQTATAAALHLTAGYTDRWLVSCVLGAGRTRELALSTRGHEAVGCLPIVGMAARVHRTVAAAAPAHAPVAATVFAPPPVVGCLFVAGVPTRTATGLPVHVHAYTLLLPADRAVAMSTSAVLASCGAPGSYASHGAADPLRAFTASATSGASPTGGGGSGGSSAANAFAALASPTFGGTGGASAPPAAFGMTGVSRSARATWRHSRAVRSLRDRSSR